MAIDILTLALAKKMSGSSGGSAIQSDWNQNDETASDYIKNRPFYESSGLEVISECEISSISSNSYTDGSKLYSGNVSLPSAEYVYGKEYTIEINGETYVMSLTQQLDNMIGSYNVGFNIADGATVVGTPKFNNNVLFGAYAFDIYPELSDGDTFTASLNVYLAQTVSLPATIRVGLEAETLVQLDPKYLPDSAKSDWNQNDASQPGYIKNRPFYDSTEETVLIDETITITSSYYENSQFIYEFGRNLGLVVGNSYNVTFLGETFENVAYNGNMQFTLSSGATINIVDDHINSFPGDGMSRPFDADIKIWSTTEEIVKIDSKYLPDNIGGVTPIYINGLIEVSTGKEITLERGREIMAAFFAGTPVYYKHIEAQVMDYFMITSMQEYEGSGGLGIWISGLKMSNGSASIYNTNIY